MSIRDKILLKDKNIQEIKAKDKREQNLTHNLAMLMICAGAILIGIIFAIGIITHL